MSHYDEQYNKNLNIEEHPWEYAISKDDILHTHNFFLDNDKVLWNDRTLKDTINKPEGARFCYLSSLEYITPTPTQLKGLGEALHNIVIANESNSINECKLHLSATVSHILDNENKQEIIDNLIKLRAWALSTGKYEINSYKNPIDIKLLLDATARHYIKLILLCEVDEESGCLHISHILANLIMIAEQLYNRGI